MQSGIQNKQIAEMLCVSVKTVENHKENIKKKLEVFYNCGLITSNGKLPYKKQGNSPIDIR